MKKEVLVAIISGLILGLIVTFGIFTANRSLEKQKQQSQTEASESPAASDTLINKSLTIIYPYPNALVDQPDLEISGIAWPNAVIAIITEDDEIILTANQEGAFVHSIKLIKGFNELTIIAADEVNESHSQNLIVTYSTEIIELSESKQETE